MHFLVEITKKMCGKVVFGAWQTAPVSPGGQCENYYNFDYGDLVGIKKRPSGLLKILVQLEGLEPTRLPTRS